MGLGQRYGGANFYSDEFGDDFDFSMDNMASPARRKKRKRNKSVSVSRKRAKHHNRRRKHRQSHRKAHPGKKRRGMSKEFLKNLRRKHGLGEFKKS